jgi:Icc-related predicted phosphoesterase
VLGRRRSGGGRRGAGSNRSRVLFVTDLHASEVTFRKAIKGVQVYEADALIVGGDLTGKQIVPLVQDGLERVTGDLMGTTVTVCGDEELERLETTIRNLGQYPVVMTAGEYECLAASEEIQARTFVDACHAQVAAWMARLAQRLGDQTPVFVTGGNDDYLSIEPILDSAEWIVNAEGRVVELLPGVAMISSGYGNVTPWNCPRDESEEQLGARIEAMAAQLDDSRQAVFNLHVPPHASGLDTCMQLDTTVSPPRPVPGAQIEAGSTAVRQTIERHQPALSLHGHIHESRGVRKIGVTRCVNPGSEYSEGILNAAIIDFRGEEVASVQLVAA